MPNLQIFQRGPTKSSQASQQIMQSLGQLGQTLYGIKQNEMMQKQQKEQQGMLAKALFPDNPEQQQIFSRLTPEQQIAAQKNLLAQQKQNQGQQLFQEMFGSQENKAPQPIPESGLAEAKPMPSDPTTWTDAQIKKAMAFDKQPGDAGIIGTMAKNEYERRKESEKLDYNSFKDNKEYTEKVLTGYEAYKRDKSVLDQMDRLAERGQLTTPLGNMVLSKLGIPVGVLGNPDSEQFEKLSQELMKNITSTYGSRILQTEVVSFMKSIPSLMNSPEGQKRLIEQWQILNEGKKIYYDAYKDIRKESPNRLPPDLHEKVIEKAESKLDDLSERFRQMNSFVNIIDPNGVIRSVPENMVEQLIGLGAKRV